VTIILCTRIVYRVVSIFTYSVVIITYGVVVNFINKIPERSTSTCLGLFF